MFLSVQQLNKQFGKQKVLDGLSLELAARETLAILGRSGGGKTTLLKVIAGLEAADEGKILLEGKEINRVAAHERGIVYLYQEALLFPHLNVFDNLAFGLRLRSLPKGQVRERVEQMLHSLGLQEQAKKMPEQLSGGQKQRVNFGRALIINPRLLLLDEPFGNLDVGTRTRMQQFFQQIASQFQISSLFVTHDLKEALLMGDQIALLQGGSLRTYPSREAFLNDPETGAKAEIAFWQEMGVGGGSLEV